MKRICALLLTAALLTGPAAAAGETAEAAQPALDLSAASAVLMEKETGTLLYEKASHRKKGLLQNVCCPMTGNGPRRRSTTCLITE